MLSSAVVSYLRAILVFNLLIACMTCMTVCHKVGARHVGEHWCLFHMKHYLQHQINTNNTMCTHMRLWTMWYCWYVFQEHKGISSCCSYLMRQIRKTKNGNTYKHHNSATITSKTGQHAANHVYWSITYLKKWCFLRAVSIRNTWQKQKCKKCV